MKRAVRFYRGGCALPAIRRGCVQTPNSLATLSLNRRKPAMFDCAGNTSMNDRRSFCANRSDVQQKDVLERAENLLDPSNRIRMDDPEIWREAADVLQSLSRMSINSTLLSMERVDGCIRLFDKLANALPQDEVLFASLLDTSILNNVLGHWLRGIKILNRQNQYDPSSNKKSNRRRQRGQPILPTDMAEKIDKYRWCSLVQPDHKTFFYVLDAASMERGNFANELLEKLLQVSKNTPSNILIDVASVCIVMKAWTQRRRPEKAEDWLRRMQVLCQDHGWQQMQPNTVAYTTVIHGWAQVGNADRAEDILKEQLSEFQDGNDTCRPDTRTFNAVLNAWAKAKQSPKAVDRCGSIIDQMIELSSNAGWDCAPDEYSITSTVVCFQNNAGPKKVEVLLEQLLEATKVTPSIATYNAILHGFAQAGNGEEAEKLLQTIIKNDQTSPDEITFNTVLSAWAKSNAPSAPQRAESILQTMQEEYKIRPSVVSFGAVLQCWCQYAKTFESGAAAAEQVLRQMQQQDGVKPNIICYNIVLSAWAAVAREFKNKDALEKATLLLHEVLQEETKIRPTNSTFRTMFHLIAGSTVRNKAERARAVADLMERCGLQPSKGDVQLIKRLSKPQSRSRRSKASSS